MLGWWAVPDWAAPWFVPALVGSFGGFVYPLLFKHAWPFPTLTRDRDGKVTGWDPGVLADMLIGGVTGVVFWQYVLNGDNSLRAMIGALAAGAGGGSFLVNFVQQKALQENEANLRDRDAKLQVEHANVRGTAEATSTTIQNLLEAVDKLASQKENTTDG